MLKALGAQVVRTPTEAAHDSPQSHISTAILIHFTIIHHLGVAEALNRDQTFDSIILDQYSNANNPLAHFSGTAEEIIEDCGDRLDMVVVGAGTGGTITGIASRLKQVYPEIVVIGVDPEGSILAPSSRGSEPRGYLVEGIGYDFVPRVLDTSLVDDWIVTDDAGAFRMARRLIRSEGLLVGGSSGSAMWAAIKAIKRYAWTDDSSKRILVILPDSVRNYMSKFIDNSWMFRNKLISAQEFIHEFSSSKKLNPLSTDRTSNLGRTNQRGSNNNNFNLKNRMQFKPVKSVKINLNDDENDIVTLALSNEPILLLSNSDQIIGLLDSKRVLQGAFMGLQVTNSSSSFIDRDFVIWTEEMNDQDYWANLIAGVTIIRKNEGHFEIINLKQ